jgi:type IX secretion system PorP/SprF family membrane protein
MTELRAQDFHLAQYDQYSMYLNPALTGNFLGEDADYRVATVYRSQWRPLTSKPYVTYGAGYEMPYKKFGLGGYLLDNRSGGMNFNTLNFQLSGSYFITDPKTSPHLLNVGLQTGLFYKTFNMNNLLFESQYDYSSGQLNPAINNGENFSRFSRTNFDANMGFFYKYKKEGLKYQPFGGLALFHVNMPVETFSTYSNRLPIRWNLHGGCDVQIDEKWRVTPMFLYMSQAKAWELNLGALGYYKLDDSKEVKYELIFGLNYRVKDAVILQAGCKKDNFVLRMSYDINTSALRTYSNGRGAFELTLVFTGKFGQSPFKSMASF